MNEDVITKREHEEFARRQDEENRRQNKRIDALESNCKYSKRIETLESEVKELHNISAKIERLAIIMENMMQEQKEQGKRLETLEKRDGEKWRNVTGYIITAVIGIVIGFIFKQIGM